MNNVSRFYSVLYVLIKSWEGEKKGTFKVLISVLNKILCPNFSEAKTWGGCSPQTFFLYEMSSKFTI